MTELEISRHKKHPTWRMVKAREIWDAVEKEAGLNAKYRSKHEFYIICLLMDYTIEEVKRIILNAKPTKLFIKTKI